VTEALRQASACVDPIGEHVYSTAEIDGRRTCWSSADRVEASFIHAALRANRRPVEPEHLDIGAGPSAMTSRWLPLDAAHRRR
jgi:hypothetical protein